MPMKKESSCRGGRGKLFLLGALLFVGAFLFFSPFGSGSSDADTILHDAVATPQLINNPPHISSQAQLRDNKDQAPAKGKPPHKNISPATSEVGVPALPKTTRTIAYPRPLHELPPLAALVISTQASPQLPHTLANMLTVLPDDLPIFVLHGPGNAKYVKKVIANFTKLEAARISTIASPYDKFNRQTYQKFLVSKWLWDHAPAQKVLHVELDAALCVGSNRSLDQFTKWDYIGAPWSPTFQHCPLIEHCVGNSGLSILATEALRRIAATYNDTFFDTVVDHDCIDCWLSMELQIGKVRGKVAPVSVARFFSIETVYEGGYTPFGTHKAVANLGLNSNPHLNELVKRCPASKVVQCDSLGAYEGAGWKCK